LEFGESDMVAKKGPGRRRLNGTATTRRGVREQERITEATEKQTPFLRAIPGVGRMRALRPGADAQVGVLVDAFASFATLDGELSQLEADLILDMLRSAFPEVDHGWLGRRLQRAVRNPRPLQALAMELKRIHDDASKLSLGLQLFTLVDAAGRSERSRASFEVFMRRLGRPEYGTAILREMRGDIESPASDDLPFERLIFGRDGADVACHRRPSAGVPGLPRRRADPCEQHRRSPAVDPRQVGGNRVLPADARTPAIGGAGLDAGF
jgi:hypothetical protein